jgi:hypothetical protein
VLGWRRRGAGWEGWEGRRVEYRDVNRDIWWAAVGWSKGSAERDRKQERRGGSSGVKCRDQTAQEEVVVHVAVGRRWKGGTQQNEKLDCTMMRVV